MKPRKQVRRNLTNTAPSRQPQTQPALARHGCELKPGRDIGPFLTPGLGGFWDYSDKSLLSFVSDFIAYNFSAPKDLSTEEARDLAEAVIIAQTVENTAGDFQHGFRFPLPGLASHRTHTVLETLEYLATLWHRSQAEWRRRDRAGNMDAEIPVCGIVRHQNLPFYWAQITFVCDAVLCRAGVLEEIPHESIAHREAARHYTAALALASQSAPDVIAIKRKP